MSRTPFDKLPASGWERGIGISRFKANISITNGAAQQQLTGQTAEQTLASINHDTANNATLTNLYEQDKESIQTGFAIGRGLTQNFATFMNDMAQDMDSVANSPAVDKEGKPITDADGKRLTNQEAYQAGFELGDTVNAAGESINYGTRQDLWGSGGTGNRIVTALIGAYSGNVSNGASTLLQNTVLNVVRTYGATEIKRLADSFSTETDDKGNPIPNSTSETVRGLLHAIAGCAGASATGGDCTSAGLASAGTVAMNNAMTALLNLNPNEMTDTQKQAYSNLMGTLVAGVSTAVGGDAAAAALASRVEVDDNWLNAPDAAEKRKLELRMGQRPSQSEIERRAVLINRNLQNDKEYAVACKDKNSSTCKQYVTTKINSAIATYYGGGANTFNKDEYRELVNIQYRVTQAWSAADRKQNQANTQKMTNAVAAMNDPTNKAEAERLYQLQSQNDAVNAATGATAANMYGQGSNIETANEVAGLPPRDTRTTYDKVDQVGTVSGRVAAVATAGAAACTETIAGAGICGLPLAGIAVGAGAVSVGADITKQIIDPNPGAGAADIAGEIIQYPVDKYAPIASPIVNEVVGAAKDSSKVNELKNKVNNYFDIQPTNGGK